jgi:hypothetical protein
MSVNRPATVSVTICCYTEERLQDIREAVVSVQAQTRRPKEIILAGVSWTARLNVTVL